MARSKKKVEEDEAPGAPEWMVTFSDCMTLLLTFFVLLLSFSSFDDKVFRKLQMIFLKDLPAVDKSDKKNKDSVLPPEQIQTTVDLLEGSEKPTLDLGLEDNLMDETSVDFRSRKVFSILSAKIFWGNGSLITPEGGQIMTKLAAFLEEVEPRRVVVCESNPVNEEGGEEVGLLRAWAVIEHLTNGRKLEKKLFSVSAGNTMTDGGLGSDAPRRAGLKSARTLEIVLLERSM